MNISSRCDYALRAMIELARRAPSGKPCTATSIAEQRDIPEKYLVHILLQLKRAALVQSIRGAQGGYVLARPPESVSLLDIVVAVDGPLLQPLPGGDARAEDVGTAWKKVADGLSEVLKEITIQSILDESSTPEMYFI